MVPQAAIARFPPRRADERAAFNADAAVGYNRPMSDQEVILLALARVRRRLQASRRMHDALIVLCLVAVGLMLWRALLLAGENAPALAAAAILTAVIAWFAGLFALVRGHLSHRVTLARAATEADARASLDDELTTAYWFIEHPSASPWTAAQLSRAATSARALDVSRLLPLTIERGTLAATGLAIVMLLALWFAPPWPASTAVAAANAGGSAATQARQLQQLRELAAQLPPDSAAAAQMEQALRTLQRKDASAEEQQRALAAAREALEQRNLEAASTREGLYKLAQQLRGNDALKDVAQALEEGDARKAAQALQQMPSAQGKTGGAISAAGDARSEKDMQRLLEQASAAKGQEPPEVASVAAKEAIDRLNQIASQLDAQRQVGSASQALQQMQLAVAQRNTMSAGRFSQQAAQNSTASPNTGQTSMPGGIMFKSAAVAQEKQASAQQEGSKTGSALGESQADPALGNRVTPLAVQLKKEALPNAQNDEQKEAGRNWFYAESKQQRSVIELRDVQARSSFQQAQSGSAEGISVRHRQITKDYFMHLREGKP